MRQPGKCLLITSHVVSVFLLADPRSTCLCPARSIHCIARTCTERSMRCRAKSVCAAPPPPTDRVYMIFAITPRPRLFRVLPHWAWDCRHCAAKRRCRDPELLEGLQEMHEPIHRSG